MLDEIDKTATDGLLTLRQQIDALDDDIALLLQRRAGLVTKVGAWKQANAAGRCVLKPGREATLTRRVAGLFGGKGYSPFHGASIWRAIINASLAVEGEIKISVSAGDLYWLAREYFGGGVPVIRQPNPKRVLSDVFDGKCAIGVMPFIRNDEESRWWPDFIALSAGAKEKPHIFACLPFVFQGKPPHDAPRALAVGFIQPEETGDDVTYLAIEADETTSMHKVQTAFAQSKLQGNWVDIAALPGGRRYHVVEISGFITPQHEAFKQFERNMGSSLMSTVFLGACAAPLVCEAK